MAIGLLAVSLVPATAVAVDIPNPLYVVVNGPTLVAISETHSYSILALGGHGADPSGNYSFTARVLGPKVSDATVSPGNGVSKVGTFLINLTAPSQTQDIRLEVNVTGYSALGSDKLTKEVTIKVVRPIVLTAKVVNSGSAALTGVPIVFYVDDAKVFNTTFSLAAKGSRTIIYNLTAELASGQHLVRVELDPSNQFARFEGGGSVFTKTIYFNGPDYGSTDAILILLLAMLMFVTYVIYKRPKRKRKK